MLYTVILIDDDPVSNFISKTLLADSGRFEPLITFSNSTKAYEYLKAKCLEFKNRNLANLLLLDVNMPIMDGFEVIEGFKEHCPDIRNNTALCLLSNSSHKRDIDRAKSLGAEHYITKPLTKDDVEYLIKILEQKED